MLVTCLIAALRERGTVFYLTPRGISIHRSGQESEIRWHQVLLLRFHDRYQFSRKARSLGAIEAWTDRDHIVFEMNAFTYSRVSRMLRRLCRWACHVHENSGQIVPPGGQSPGAAIARLHQLADSTVAHFRVHSAGNFLGAAGFAGILLWSFLGRWQPDRVGEALLAGRIIVAATAAALAANGLLHLLRAHQARKSFDALVEDLLDS
jgi:hypothetical protein